MMVGLNIGLFLMLDGLTLLGRVVKHSNLSTFEMIEMWIWVPIAKMPKKEKKKKRIVRICGWKLGWNVVFDVER